jgi:regulator of sigma E protease
VSYVIAAAGFALLIVLHEAGHFAAAKAVGMRVERFSLFFGRHLVKVRRGETEYGIGWIPLGGLVKITGMSPHEEMAPDVAPRAYFRQPVWKRLVVIGAGPLVNLVLAFLILWGAFWASGTFRSDGRISEVAPGSPAAEVLRPGDRIVAVDGKEGDLGQLSGQIARHRCPGTQRDGCEARSPAVITVLRDGQRRTFEITPRYSAEERRPLAGFSYGRDRVDLGPGEAATESLALMWQVTEATAEIIGRLFYSAEARDELSGVVGSYETTRQAVLADYEIAIRILALISLSLAVVNLLPFLPLDGGHIFWALAEKLRGRAIPFSVMERASVVGFVLVLLLFAIGLENDIDRLGNGEFKID